MYYSHQQINDRYYRIIANGENCCELVVGDTRAALIDTGLGFGNLRQAVEEITKLPVIILNTHSHVDHTGGNALFDAPAYMGQEDIDTLEYSCGYDNRANSVRRHMHEMDMLKAEGFDPDEYIARPFRPVYPCSEGDIFDLGGVTIRVFHTPGHSLGGKSYYWEEYHYLFTGDAVYPRSLVFGYGSASREEHIRTLRKIQAVPFDCIWANHLSRPMTHRELDLYIKIAVEADYNDGVPFPNPIRDGADARTICLPGMVPEDEGKEGFAAIVLSSYS